MYGTVQAEQGGTPFRSSPTEGYLHAETGMPCSRRDRPGGDPNKATVEVTWNVGSMGAGWGHCSVNGAEVQVSDALHCHAVGRRVRCSHR